MIPGRSRLRVSPHLFRSRQVILALLIAAAFGLELVGCGPLSRKPPTPTPLVLVEMAPSPTTVGLATATPFSGIELTAMPSPETPIPATPTATPCGPPDYWAAYVVQAGDTLFSLAAKTQTSVVQIKRANCLDSDDLVVGQSLYLPFIPTPTACGPPANWVAYVAQAGDTLFSLAAKTQVSVEQVKRANCLVGDDLVVGQSLYLPFIPAPPTPVPQPAPPTPIPQPAWPTPIAQPVQPTPIPQPAWPTPIPPQPIQPTPIAPPVQPTPIPPSVGIAEADCSSPFSCPNPELVPMELPVGGPNEPEFKPCQSEEDIEFDTDRKIVELGQQRFIYVCVADPVSASLLRSDGMTQPVELLETVPDPDLQKLQEGSNAQAVIDWPALPFEPPGVYTLTVKDSNGTPVDFRFKVVVPEEERILTVPPAGPPGTVFLVYYVNFGLGDTFTFDLYGEDRLVVGGDHTLGHIRSWPITITHPLTTTTEKGWAMAPLASRESDRQAAYSIGFDNKRIGSNLFWLR